MAVKTSALSSTVRPFRARASRGTAAPRGRLRMPKNYLSVLDFDAAGFAHMLELASRLVERGVLTGVEVADIPAADARAAREMVLLGSSVKVAPIVEWDGRPIGTGKPGPAAAALLELIEEDMRSGDRLLDVPY